MGLVHACNPSQITAFGTFETMGLRHGYINGLQFKNKTENFAAYIYFDVYGKRTPDVQVRHASYHSTTKHKIVRSLHLGSRCGSAVK
jgi:hypothetical protein